MDEMGRMAFEFVSVTEGNSDEKSPVHRALQEWESNTTPHPKTHPIGNEIHMHSFRRFGEAIAWLEQCGDCIVITKVETLQPRGGGPSRLIEFLITLADKYQIELCGHARKYVPDLPVPEGHLLTKEELEIFYKKRGFHLREIDRDTSEMSYVPRNISVQ